MPTDARLDTSTPARDRRPILVPGVLIFVALGATVASLIWVRSYADAPLCTILLGMCP